MLIIYYKWLLYFYALKLSGIKTFFFSCHVYFLTFFFFYTTTNKNSFSYYLLFLFSLFLIMIIIFSQESKHKSHLENATKLHQNVEALSSLHFNFYQELKALQAQEVFFFSVPLPKRQNSLYFFFLPLLFSLSHPLPQEKEESEGGKEGDEEKKEITLGGVVKEKLVGELSWYREYTQNFENYQQFTEEKAFKRFLDAEVRRIICKK